MKKILIVLIVLIFLNFSQQLDCSDYSYSSSCGLFNTGYKFQCFMSSSTCQEVKVESGCQMKEGSCQKEGDAQNVECHLYDHEIASGKNLKVCKKIIVDSGCKVSSPTDCDAKTDTDTSKQKCEYTEDYSHCKLYDKTCEDYNTIECGSLALGINSGTNQCYFTGQGNCQEVLIDEYCYMDDNEQCTKRKKFNETLYKCSPGTEDEKQTCKRIAKKCEEQNTLDKCREFGANCYKVNIQGRTTSCNEVKVISPKCKIDTNGNCVADQADTDYENCDFIQENGEYKCGPINKACNEVANNDKCNKIELADGQICRKVKGYTTYPCKDVLIDPECQIDANGECKIITPSKNNKCQYVNSFYKCQFYEIDSECKIEGNTCENNGNPPEGKKCDFVDQSRTKCKLRDIRCDEISQDQCDGENVINRQSGRKCSWNGSNCKEYKIDNVCTVTSADQCDKKADATLQKNYKCLFTNSSLLECIQKQDTCESYYTGCSSHNIENQIQCIDNYPNCKKIEIDENCEVNDRGSCVTKNGKTIDSKKKCDFWNEEKTICKIMDKPCGEFDNKNDCHAVDNCAYITPYNFGYLSCYLTETKDNSVCKIDGNRDCIPANQNSIANYETCNFKYDYENNKAICQKRNLGCNEILDQNICNSVKTDEQQCIYGGTSCLELKNDDYCYYNTNEGKCTFRSGNQPSNYYCTTTINNGVYSCKRAEKKCSSITKANDCNSFTPVDRQCFYVQGHGNNYECKNIEVDSQCKINEEGKCTGNGCAYDDDDKKNHCAYKNNDSSILKVKRLLLLALFFIF